MTQIITILGNALQAVPATVIPFLFVMALIGYLSYKIFNTTLVELSTTLKIMREERQNEHR